MIRPKWKYHYSCGKHSGFHLCCILWFLTFKWWAECLEWVTRKRLSDSISEDELNKLCGDHRLGWTYNPVDDEYAFYEVSPIINKYFLESHKGILHIRCPICRILDRRIKIKRCDCRFECGE